MSSTSLAYYDEAMRQSFGAYMNHCYPGKDSLSLFDAALAISNLCCVSMADALSRIQLPAPGARIPWYTVLKLCLAERHREPCHGPVAVPHSRPLCVSAPPFVPRNTLPSWPTAASTPAPFTSVWDAYYGAITPAPSMHPSFPGVPTHVPVPPSLMNPPWPMYAMGPVVPACHVNVSQMGMSPPHAVPWTAAQSATMCDRPALCIPPFLPEKHLCGNAGTHPPHQKSERRRGGRHRERPTTKIVTVPLLEDKRKGKARRPKVRETASDTRCDSRATVNEAWAEAAAALEMLPGSVSSPSPVRPVTTDLRLSSVRSEASLLSPDGGPGDTSTPIASQMQRSVQEPTRADAQGNGCTTPATWTRDIGPLALHTGAGSGVKVCREFAAKGTCSLGARCLYHHVPGANGRTPGGLSSQLDVTPTSNPVRSPKKATTQETLTTPHTILAGEAVSSASVVFTPTWGNPVGPPPQNSLTPPRPHFVFAQPGNTECASDVGYAGDGLEGKGNAAPRAAPPESAEAWANPGMCFEPFPLEAPNLFAPWIELDDSGVDTT